MTTHEKANAMVIHKVHEVLNQGMKQFKLPLQALQHGQKGSCEHQEHLHV